MTHQRVAIVTGASRGIGAATARRLAADGFAVCVNFRAQAAAAMSVVEAIRASGGRAMAVQSDIADEAAVVAMFDRVAAELGLLDALVNNAAIALPQMRLEDMSVDRIRQVFETNVFGTFVCCREAVRRMSTKHGGVGGGIVNVSSAASRIGSPNEYIDYAATKGAVDTLTRGLALEVAAEGIRVNCVRPGFIATDMHASAGEPHRLERLRSTIPLGRGGEPEEVAAAVAWLLSSDASYTTGAFIDVAGGR